MAHFVTLNKRGRIYIIEDTNEELGVTGEKYLELILEADKAKSMRG